MKKNKNISGLIIFLIIILLVNLVSLSIFYRIDLSKGHIYSLSKASKEVVKNLDDRLVIKAYFTKNLPDQLADTRRFVRDLLSEYQAYSHGKLRFEFIDPSDEKKLQDEARKNRIEPVSMRVAEHDEFVVKKVYLGLAFLYEGKTETIPLVQNTQGLEYDITSTIKKITSIGQIKIALYSKEDPDVQAMMRRLRGISNNYQTLREMLSKNYEIQNTDLNSKLNEDVKMLIFAGTKDSLDDKQLYNLDQFVMNGGNLLIFQDGVDANLQEQTAKPIKSNIFDLLAHYGIKIEKTIVTDAECNSIQIQRRAGFFSIATPVKYPPLIIANKVNKNNEIVKRLDQLQFIFASPIDSTNISKEITFTPLIYSSDHSGIIPAPRYDIGYMQFMNKDLNSMLKEHSKILAAIYEGKFKSYFADNDSYKDATKESKDTKIIVVSDSDFITELGAGKNPSNIDFCLNSVDYLTGNDILIGLRSREIQYKPLKELTPSGRRIVKWINVLLSSILLILFGIFRYKAELKRRKHIGEVYE